MPLNNLNDSQVPRLRRQVRAAGTATPMNNSAIGRGGVEVYDGGIITVTNGGLSVTGTAEVIGRLVASGIVNFTGEVTITGPLEVSGLTHLMNDLIVASGGRIVAGTIELNPDGSAKFGAMTVSTSGKVQVGTAMALDPGVSSGALVFSNGAQVFTDATTVQMFKGGSVCQIDDASAKLQATGGYVKVDSSGVNLNGPLRNTSGSSISGVTANVYMDASGNIKKIV